MRAATNGRGRWLEGFKVPLTTNDKVGFTLPLTTNFLFVSEEGVSSVLDLSITSSHCGQLNFSGNHFHLTGNFN